MRLCKVPWTGIEISLYQPPNKGLIYVHSDWFDGPHWGIGFVGIQLWSSNGVTWIERKIWNLLDHGNSEMGKL